MKQLIGLLFVLALPSAALAQTKVLVIGASITWGCVSHCFPTQTEPGYLERLRALLPSHDVRALTWFSAGIADWDPESPVISAQSLHGTVLLHGVGELRIRERTNLWDLFAGPHIAGWQPDYVLFVLGAGDILRVLRTPSLPVTTPEDYAAAMRRLSSAVIAGMATPVYVFDTPFDESFGSIVDGFFAEYREAMLAECDLPLVECIPDIFDVIDRVDHFADTDFIHFNAQGHQAYAEAIADWLLARSGEEEEDVPIDLPPVVPPLPLP